MAHIKIVATPPGQAPLKIREQWVGLSIPVAENLPADTVQMGVLGGKAENPNGYTVETEAAIQELEKKSPEAASWWRQNIIPELMPWLSFHRDVCEIVP